MKKMRKLIPAFAMLMVSAIMLSTASFAWFSSNTQAEANGMQIKAQTSGGLAIAVWTKDTVDGVTVAKAPLDSAFASSVDIASTSWTNGASAVAPTSHNGTNWYSAVAASVDSYAKNTEAYELVANGKEHYLQTTWSIKSLAADKQTNVRVTAVEVSGITNETVNTNFAKSLRVAIYNRTTGTWYYFAPKQDAAATELYHVNSTADGRVAYAADGITVGASSLTTQVLTNVTSTTAQVIDVYLYFEGEDENCKSANAVNLDTISVNLVFTAAGGFTDVTP